MDTDVSALTGMLTYCTRENGNFLTIAVNEPKETKYRRNLAEILDADEF